MQSAGKLGSWPTHWTIIALDQKKFPTRLFTPLEKVFCIVVGVVLPVVCFSLASDRYPLEPEWQGDGYLTFLPEGRIGFPFYPLLLWSMVALCVFVVRPGSSRSLALRIGLYTGVVLAAQYSFIQTGGSVASLLGAPFYILISNMVLLFLLTLARAVEKLAPKAFLVIGAVIVAVLPGVVIAYGLSWFRGGMQLIVIPAPAWCVGVFGYMAFVAREMQSEIVEEPADERNRFVAWFAWVSAYAVAWKWSIGNALVLYAQLPKTQPRCYIATAAATGHQRFVGSTGICTADGAAFYVNAQLCRLKCVEIAMAAIWPRGHRLLRLAYDLAGPRLARRVARHPLLADVAFVLLKPIEWLPFASWNWWCRRFGSWPWGSTIRLLAPIASGPTPDRICRDGSRDR